METDSLSQNLHAYAEWKTRVADQIQVYQNLLIATDMGSMEQGLRLDDVANQLDSDHIVIAFVAEFSRGKTELINSIFFADYKRRLLPSEAGRTTMCPTELFYDSKCKHAYIRLLPIETRLDDASIAEHKRNLEHWMTFTLDVSSPDQMAETFKEVVKVKKVPYEEAVRLGLGDDFSTKNPPPDEVEIPKWRHAMISFPHPLLREGLVILDTPGLNALGTEPELTMDMLPNAHAVVFVLSADTGVTKTDMEMWQQHVHAIGGDTSQGLLVVLNKIDTLWDELVGDEAIQRNITSQCEKTAVTLGVSVDKVVPVSAQKALLAKIKEDAVLLDKSGIPTVEKILSNDILPHKQRIVRDRVLQEVGGMVKSTANVLGGRYQSTAAQLQELQALGDKNVAMISHLIKTTREEAIAYEVRVENFNTSRRLLTNKTAELLEYLNIKTLDELVVKTREQMSGSWTTGGLKNNMKFFFEQSAHTMNQVLWLAEQANEVVQTIYRRFHEEYDLSVEIPPLLNSKLYQSRLEHLQAREEEYRNSAVLTVSEQHFVVKKFFISIASHAREIFYSARQDVEKWAKSVLAPLATEIKERKLVLDKRMENLTRIKESRDTLEVKIKELSAQEAELKNQLMQLKGIQQAITAPLSFDGKADGA